MADFEGRVRGLGQRFQQAGQDLIKKNVDDPVQQLREEMARRQAEKARAEGMAGAPPPELNGQKMQAGYQPRPGDKIIPHVLPDDPNAPESQKQARMAAMIAATENLSRIKEKEAAQRGQYEAEDAERAQAERDFDPSQYKKVERRGQPGQDGQPITPPKFGGLAAQMQQSPQLEQPGGMIELSDDPEEMQRQIEAAHRGR